MPPPQAVLGRLTSISLRVRLTLWYGALVLLVLLGFTAFAYLEVRNALNQGVDATLRDRAIQIAAVTTVTGSGVQFQVDGVPSGLGDGAVFVFDRLGKLLEPRRLGRASPPDYAAVRQAMAGKASFTSSPDNLRLYTALVSDDAGQPFIIQVSGPLKGADQTLSQVLTALLLAAPILVLVSGAGGAFLAGRTLRPIDRIIRTARRISARGLDERLNLPKRNDEIGRLASTFDEMLDRLEGAFAHQRRFAADASHELRTPLTVLRGEVEVALRRTRTPESYESTLHTVEDQIERMGAIVEDLLALARADSGQAEIERDLVPLDDLVTRAAAGSRPLFASKGLSLEVQVEPGIYVIGDPDKLSQLVLNLLSNAARYTDQGGATITLRRESGLAFLTVRDSGIGIPQEHLPHIFERFYRVDKARSRAAGGSGLGLAIAQHVAEAHGGTIQVEGTNRQGTAFRVTLPAA